MEDFNHLKEAIIAFDISIHNGKPYDDNEKNIIISQIDECLEDLNRIKLLSELIS